MNARLATVLVAAAATTATASAGYTITQQNAPAPTYSNTLNFDEPGALTGPVPANAYASLGIAQMFSGTGDQSVGDNSVFYPWVNDGNSMFANFGINVIFDAPISEFSIQVWDPSGPPSFIGGGLQVALFNQGEQVWDLVAQNGSLAEPAWGGVGDSWFDITTTDGMTFDEVRIFGLGFTPTAFIDNLSWNTVPAPSALALVGIAGLGATRRRR
ncbi:MAG: PEP-CTERM sorting domain-containing protein [Phycisphaerales bacterium JB050]